MQMADGFHDCLLAFSFFFRRSDGKFPFERWRHGLLINQSTIACVWKNCGQRALSERRLNTWTGGAGRYAAWFSTFPFLWCEMRIANYFNSTCPHPRAILKFRIQLSVEILLIAGMKNNEFLWNTKVRGCKIKCLNWTVLNLTEL